MSENMYKMEWNGNVTGQVRSQGIEAKMKRCECVFMASNDKELHSYPSV